MKILVASTNPHKIEEIRAVFATCAPAPGSFPGSSSGISPAKPGPSGPDMSESVSGNIGAGGIELVSLADISGGADIPEAVEDEPTFAGNAAKKARHYAQASGLWCLADDSGLEVDALKGEPGVHSARFAGVSGPRSVVDPANNQLLLERLRLVPLARRTARFVCTMALVDPAQAQPLALVRGTVEGRILLPEECADPAQAWRGKGRNGFGYDPLFLIPALNQTTAELSPERKNALSHRGQASRLMWREIVRLRLD